MLCSEHNNAEWKGPNSRGNYWHVLDYAKGEYHNVPAADLDDKPEYTKQMADTAQEIREKIAPERDFVAEVRGKVRNTVVSALIQHRGLSPLTPGDIDILETYVDYIMETKK